MAEAMGEIDWLRFDARRCREQAERPAIAAFQDGIVEQLRGFKRCASRSACTAAEAWPWRASIRASVNHARQFVGSSRGRARGTCGGRQAPRPLEHKRALEAGRRRVRLEPLGRATVLERGRELAFCDRVAAVTFDRAPAIGTAMAPSEAKAARGRCAGGRYGGWQPRALGRECRAALRSRRRRARSR